MFTWSNVIVCWPATVTDIYIWIGCVHSCYCHIIQFIVENNNIHVIYLNILIYKVWINLLFPNNRKKRRLSRDTNCVSVCILCWGVKHILTTKVRQTGIMSLRTKLKFSLLNTHKQFTLFISLQAVQSLWMDVKVCAHVGVYVCSS